MIWNYSDRKRDEAGAAAIIMSVLLSSSLLFGMGALAVDLGQMYQTRREAQMAADLAALAGGAFLQAGDFVDACQEAVDYLDENRPKGVSLWDTPPTCTTTGTVDSTGNPDIAAYDNAGAPLRSVSFPSDSSIRVVVPAREVKFGFATAMGISHAHVTAAATVALRNYGLGIGPFAIPAGCVTTAATDWYMAAKDDTKGDGSCTDAEGGSFGWLGVNRVSKSHPEGKNTGADVLAGNAQYGADHPIKAVEVPESSYGLATDATPECNGLIAGVSYTPRPDDQRYTLPLMANCVDVEPGNVASVSENLVGKSGKCDGRLNQLTGTKVRTFDGCSLDGHRLTDFLLNGGTDLTPVQLGTADVLSHTIVDNPNFFIVPVLFTKGRPDKYMTPVVGFRGFYLDCDTPTCVHPFDKPKGVPITKGPITELNGYLFDLDTIAPAPGSVDDLHDYYVGSGPAVPVLVRDGLN